MSNNQNAEQIETPREWVVPQVTKMHAGSAEDSSGPATDGITNPS
jgi:hypothetical protein